MSGQIWNVEGRMNYGKMARLGAAYGLTLVISIVQAAETSKDELAEVVVTASKTGAQDLQSTPLAVQVFSGEEMKQENVNNLADLIASIPGAYEGQNQSVASRSYNLRGVGGSNANGDSPVGYYVDDVPFNVINFGIAPPIRFIDVERVEVLRGPQGTLYGQGAAGGVFIFHTKDPDLKDFRFSAESTLSQTNDAAGLNYEVTGMVSVPVIEDKLGLRVSGGTLRNQGYADVYYGAFDGTPDDKDVNKVFNDDIRVLGLYRPIENLNIRAQYWHFRPRQDFLGFLSSTESPPYYTNTAGQPSYGNGDFTLYSLSFDLALDGIELTSATSYMKGTFGIYVPIAPAGFFSSQFFPKNFTQELRAYSTGSDAFHWVLGAQYQDGQGPQENQIEIPAFGLSNNANNNTLVKNWALYGEASYDLMGGKVVPLFGLRQYHESRTFADGLITGNPAKRDVTTWRVNVSYLPSDDLTVFATAATGFRPGIVQSVLQATLLQLDGIPASTQLDPEDVTNYEIGMKWRNAGRTLNVGLNAFYTTIHNQQTSVNSSAGVGGFVNFGDAKIEGLDFELQWATPLAGLTLGLVGNVNNGEYTYIKPGLGAALPNLVVGGRMVNAIEYNYRLDANYNTSLGNDLNGFGNISFGRTGDRFGTDGRFTDPYNIINASIGIRRGAWDAALTGNNLSDERGPTSFFGNTPNGGISPVPRTFGIRVRYSK
jgi:iron complex outermembrane recepter protein